LPACRRDVEAIGLRPINDDARCTSLTATFRNGQTRMLDLDGREMLPETGSPRSICREIGAISSGSTLPVTPSTEGRSPSRCWPTGRTSNTKNAGAGKIPRPLFCPLVSVRANARSVTGARPLTRVNSPSLQTIPVVFDGELLYIVGTQATTAATLLSA